VTRVQYTCAIPMSPVDQLIELAKTAETPWADPIR
jgi:hypothetical protein